MNTAFKVASLNSGCLSYFNGTISWHNWINIWCTIVHESVVFIMEKQGLPVLVIVRYLHDRLSACRSTRSNPIKRNCSWICDFLFMTDYISSFVDKSYKWSKKFCCTIFKFKLLNAVASYKHFWSTSRGTSSWPNVLNENVLHISEGIFNVSIM